MYIAVGFPKPPAQLGFSLYKKTTAPVSEGCPFIFRAKGELPAAASAFFGESGIETFPLLSFVLAALSAFAAATFFFNGGFRVRNGFQNTDFARINVTRYAVILEVGFNKVIVLVVDADPNFLLGRRLDIRNLAFLGNFNRREVRNDRRFRSQRRDDALLRKA